MATKYEYRVVKLTDAALRGAAGEQALNELGEDGWQIVEILSAGQGARLIVLTREGYRPGQMHRR